MPFIRSSSTMKCKRRNLAASILALILSAATSPLSAQSGSDNPGARGAEDGEHLFTTETFAGNGRTCLTCHSAETGTVSPQDARERLRKDYRDPLFVFDGSDDGKGNGFSRMLDDATILIRIPLPPTVRMGDDPKARSVMLARGIPTT